MKKVVTLDHRYNGKGYFKYRIEFTKQDRAMEYIDCLHWSVETWGMSCSLNLFLDTDELVAKGTPDWVWEEDHSTSFRKLRIYLKGDQELTLFKLKWG